MPGRSHQEALGSTRARSDSRLRLCASFRSEARAGEGARQLRLDDRKRAGREGRRQRATGTVGDECTSAARARGVALLSDAAICAVLRHLRRRTERRAFSLIPGCLGGDHCSWIPRCARRAAGAAQGVAEAAANRAALRGGPFLRRARTQLSLMGVVLTERERGPPACSSYVLRVKCISDSR